MSRPPFVSEDADRLSSCNTESPRVPGRLSRRGFLVGTATAALAPKPASADPLRAVEPDIGLIELEQTFRQALDAYEAARQRFNHCEDRYFDLRPRIPEALTGDEGIAVKAHVIKTWGRPEWWDPVDGRADTYERLVAQILDAVAAAAEAWRKRDAR